MLYTKSCVQSCERAVQCYVSAVQSHVSGVSCAVQCHVSAIHSVSCACTKSCERGL